jgi:hypothetical protein
MAGKTLDFFQIYYADEQREHLYPFAIPYKNERLTPYFENSVIAELVPKSEADYISVCSWRLKEKRNDRIMQLKDTSLSYEKIVEKDFDVAVLTPVSKSHQALHMAKHWHGEPWINAIDKLKDFIKVPRELSTIIYENHFIARKEIYHEYVHRVLLPCLNFMSLHSVFYADADYAKRKTEIERERYKQNSGRADWPIAPFILERLFSIWIEGKGFRIVNV